MTHNRDKNEIRRYDAIVIGGGFYGCSIALFLKSHFGMKDVLVLERENDILKRASLINQARVHSGYHYPRSFITAFRSRKNFSRFVSEFEDCIDDSFVKLYAIAKRNSYVSAPQFVRFCKEIDAPLTPARWQFERLFSRHLVEAIFEVEEYGFDAVKLRAKLARLIQDTSVELILSAHVETVSPSEERLSPSAKSISGSSAALDQSPNQNRGEPTMLTVTYRQEALPQVKLLQAESPLVFDCTYAGLNELKRCQIPLKFEIAEMALLKVPDELANIGITVMDGPFFSVMPFPSRHLHSLSHVRYTPRTSWTSDEVVDKEDELRRAKASPSAAYMLRDAAKFLPCLSESIIEDSMFEIKTLLMKNELDDGRPILFHRPEAASPYYCVLGGKIDNIFDIYEELKASPCMQRN